MQHQKGKNNFQPNPFSLIQTDALAAIKKEINSFFMDIHFEEAQRDLLNISSDIVNKHVLKSHGDMYVRDQQYLLHRIVMLLTKLYLSNPKMECHGNN